MVFYPGGSSAGTGGVARRRVPAANNATARGNSSGGWGDAMRQANVIVPALTAAGSTVNTTTLRNADRAYLQGASNLQRPGALPQPTMYSGGGGGGRGGGGGGGGGAAAPTIDASWLQQLLSRGPTAVTSANLDLPDYNATFDPTVYNELEGKLGTAVGQSRGAAGEAYGNLENFLNSNYRNAFAQGPPQAQAPGMDQASMQRMMQAQGVNPALAAEAEQGRAAGNAGFANIWSLLGANEDIAQRNRLNRVQTDRGTTNRALDAALLGGQTGIGMQRGQAQTAFNERAEAARNQLAQQEAMANWTRQNQVSDLNASNQNAYRNQVIQALLGLAPELAAGGAYPDLAAMGF